MHGGGPAVVPGRPLQKEYTKENIGLVEKELPNLIHHLHTVKLSGIRRVVCINCFATDTQEDTNVVRRAAERRATRCAAATHWADRGDGARTG